MARQPSRYAQEGDPASIVCVDFPGISLHVERGLTIEESDRLNYPR
jgi:hypothetical protein